MKLLVYLIGLVLEVTCLGCVSYHWLLRPGVEGVVIDGKTGLPIAGAKVTFSKDPEIYTHRSKSWFNVTNIFAATDGTFSITPLQSWGHIDTVWAHDPVFYMLLISRDGYQTFTNKFWYPQGNYGPSRHFRASTVEFSTNFHQIGLLHQ